MGGGYLLNSSSESLTMVLGGAASPAPYAYVKGRKFTASGAESEHTSNMVASNGTTAVTLMAGSANYKVVVEQIDIFNADDAQVVVTVAFNNGTAYTVYKATLETGDSARYTAGKGWSFHTAIGKESIIVPTA